MGDRTKLCDYTNTPNDQFIAKPITTPEIQADSFRVSIDLLHLITKKQFGDKRKEDCLDHLNNFVSICSALNLKEPDIVMPKLFPFSLKGEAKEWIRSLPPATTKTWKELEKAFIRKNCPSFKDWLYKNKLTNSMDNEQETRSEKEPPAKKRVWVRKEKKVKNPLLDKEDCSLHELISILQKFASDPSIDVNKSGFGSYIANHVLKEKVARYNQEAMIPPKLGDVWIPKVLVTIGKETHHAILDLGSSVSVLSKELYESLELKGMKG